METEENKNPNSNQGESQVRAIGMFVWDLVKILVVALIIIVPFRMLVAEPFVVSGSSMLPSFENRDYLIIDRVTYRNNLPARGDVIVFKYPKDLSQFFIKRVIGLPGEKVQLTQGYVTIYNDEHPNGFKLEEPYLSSPVETFGNTAPVTLGSDEYFVLGDNRTASSDSRVWGILPKDDIIGKVWLRVFPLNKFGRPAKVEY